VDRRKLRIIKDLNNYYDVVCRDGHGRNSVIITTDM